MFKKFKELPTSKKLVYFLFFNCTLIELFVLVITSISVAQVTETLITPDFSPLNALVGAFVAEAVGYAIYCLKSMKENTKGGLTYEKVMYELEEDEIELEEEAEG